MVTVEWYGVRYSCISVLVVHMYTVVDICIAGCIIRDTNV